MKETSINQKLFNLQQEIGTISKDTSNPFYKSKYFDINSLINQLNPLLKKHRLLLLQPIEEDCVYSKLICVDGTGGVISALKLPEINDPQKLGSAITYYRRYTLASLLGLQAVDDDANIASGITTQKPFLNKNTPLFNTIKDKIKAGTPLSTVKSHYNAKKEVWDELNKL
jgi:hypothetical protein